MEQFKILAPKEKRLLLQEEHGSLLEKEDIIGHITFNDLISHLYSYKTQQFGKNSHNNNSNEKALTFKPNIIQKYLTNYRNKNIEKKILNGKYSISDFDMSKEYENDM